MILENWYMDSILSDDVVATGPYLDIKGSNKSVISLSSRIMKGTQLICVVQIEVLMLNLANFFESFVFLIAFYFLF